MLRLGVDADPGGGGERDDLLQRRDPVAAVVLRAAQRG
jgi:hypothetical protein